MNLDDDFFEYSEDSNDEEFQDVEFAAEDFIFPEDEAKPKDPNRRRNLIITGIAALVFLCCCCGFLWVGWNFGDQVLKFLGY